MGKIKNTEGSAMSVGLLVVRFLYSFYVCVQLPKWFTFFLVFSPLFLSGSLSFTLAPNGRNYMQLPTAVNFPVEPHRLCCGLHGLLSAPKRQLTIPRVVLSCFLFICFSIIPNRFTVIKFEC